MKEEKMKETVYSVFDDDGNILPEDQRQDITEKCLFYPENLALGRLSLGVDAPMILYKYGNAKASIHISIPTPIVESEIEKARKYAKKLAEKHIDQQYDEYKRFLDEQGIDWKKVESKIK